MTIGNPQPPQGPQKKESTNIESINVSNLGSYYEIEFDKLIRFFNQTVSSVPAGNNSEFKSLIQEQRRKFYDEQKTTQKQLRIGIEQIKKLSIKSIKEGMEQHLRASVLAALSHQEETAKAFMLKWVPGYK
jgi:hypothetical protein